MYFETKGAVRRLRSGQLEIRRYQLPIAGSAVDSTYLRSLFRVIFSNTRSRTKSADEMVLKEIIDK